MYFRANAGSDSFAPKKVRIGRSKHRRVVHASRARIAEPMTAAVKYWFSLPSFFSLPRFVLKMTLPPMPISKPRL